MSPQLFHSITRGILLKHNADSIIYLLPILNDASGPLMTNHCLHFLAHFLLFLSHTCKSEGILLKFYHWTCTARFPGMVHSFHLLCLYFFQVWRRYYFHLYSLLSWLQMSSVFKVLLGHCTVFMTFHHIRSWLDLIFLIFYGTVWEQTVHRMW